MSETAQPDYERRYGQRKQADITVYIQQKNRQFLRFSTRNLSAHGLYIQTASRFAKPGEIVELIFPIPHGNIVRLHRRQATIAHTTLGGAGMMLHHQKK